MSLMPTRLPRLLAASGLATLLAACGSGGGGADADTRCFGVAQVPGWSIHVTSDFHDHVVVDTFTAQLNATFDATASAGPVQHSHTNADAFTWYGHTPTSGSVGGVDSLQRSTVDSTVGTMSGFAPGPNASYGPYLSVNTATCKATLGALIFAKVDIAHVGTPLVHDTVLAGFPFIPDLTIDSLAVANGFTVTSGKVKSVALDAGFGTTAEYRVGGLVGLYSNTDTLRFDSATVSWTATPLSAFPSAIGPAPELRMLPNGAVLLPRR